MKKILCLTYLVSCMALFGAAVAPAGPREALPLERGIKLDSGRPFSINFLLKIDRYPDNGEGTWDKSSPMTVMMLDAGPKDTSLYLRLNRRHLILTFFGKQSGVNRTFDTLSGLTPKIWYQVSVIGDGKGKTGIYLNGVPDGLFDFNLPRHTYLRLRLGTDGGSRKLIGEIASFQLIERELSPEELKKEFLKLPVELREKSIPERSAAPLQGGGDYPRLRVSPDQFHPFIDQLHISATAVPWFDPRGRDLLIHGKLKSQGGRVAIYRFLGIHDGLPFYDQGTTVALDGCNFRSIAGPDSGFDLYAQGKNTVFGDGTIIRYRNRGKLGKPEFSAPEPVLFGGAPLPAFSAKRGLMGWDLVEPQNPGDPLRMLLALSVDNGNSRFPFEKSPWTGKEQKYAGPGKGYDIRGNWLGNNAIGEIYIADAIPGTDGLQFTLPRPIWFGKSGQYLLFKGEGGRAMQIVQLAGQPHLIIVGNVDEAVALPLHSEGNELICGEPRPLARDGYKLTDTYFPARIVPLDYDGDGNAELLFDGNPGRMAVLRIGSDGKCDQLGGALLKGGDLAVETLSSPWRFDWDGDGKADLLVGDSSGYLTFWPGTSDPMIYGKPTRMSSAGQQIHTVAGMNLSMQGPSEKRWGYLKVFAGRYGKDNAVITDDIEGKLTLYRPGKSATELSPGSEFTLNGKKFRTAWRARPAVLPAACNFAAIGRDALLILDFDGDAAIAVPAEDGGTDLRQVIKLHDADGKPLRLCGPAGLWGRAALSVVDWDGDGNWDIVFGTNSSCHKFFAPDQAGKGAMPFLLRNTGTSRDPKFAPPVPIRLKNGDLIELGNHNATPCPTDFDGDGKPDLLVGAEDGKVYAFSRKDLSE